MKASWWVRMLTGVGVAACGPLVIWVQSQDPIIGFPVTHPASIAFLALFACAGLALAVRPRGWERARARPPADLPEIVRRLADIGDEAGAAQALREATGLALSDASQAIEAYLRGRTSTAERGAPPDRGGS